MLLAASTHVSQYLAISNYLDSSGITNDTVYSNEGEPMSQYFFRDLAFWEFMFELSNDVDSIPIPQPMQFAVDGENNVFVVSGGEVSSFNQLVSRFPVFIDEGIAVEYGRFFLQINQFSESMNPLFLQDAVEIQALFQSISDTGVVDSRDIPTEITDTMSEYDPNIVIFDLLTNEYRTSNYIWLPTQHLLVFIELGVTPLGACSYIERFVYDF